jgi:hypothetical protein
MLFDMITGMLSQHSINWPYPSSRIRLGNEIAYLSFCILNKDHQMFGNYQLLEVPA